MKRFLMFLTFALAAAGAHAAAPIASIQAMLAKPAQLCGRFDQTKQLAGMKKPLVANGRFCVVVGKGILWNTLKPCPSSLRLTKDQIVQFHGDRQTMRLDTSQEPTVRMINSVLFSLLAGELSQLESLFEVDGSISGSTWKVGLKARQSALAKAIGAISLEGGAYVKTIRIDEAGGDRTEIVLSGIQTGEGAVTPQEAAQF